MYNYIGDQVCPLLGRFLSVLWFPIKLTSTTQYLSCKLSKSMNRKNNLHRKAANCSVNNCVRPIMYVYQETHNRERLMPI